MSEITIILEACEPMELMRNPTEKEVWIRQLKGYYWPLVEIRGKESEVYDYIELYWDRDVADQMVYGVGLLT
jgi:hypothetical protein